MDGSHHGIFDHDLLARLEDGEWRAATRLMASLPGGSPAPTAYELIERAREVGLELEAVDAPDGARCRLAGGGNQVVVHGLAIDEEDLRIHLHGSPDDPQDTGALLEVEWGVTLEVVLGEPVLEMYHLALQVLVALVPDVLAAWDGERLRWMGGHWIRSAAASVAPPPPTTLFTIHAIEGDDCIWLHTHGLQRCGAIELEILEDTDPATASDLMHLMNAMALWMIDHGPPPAGEPVEVGRGMPVAWVPWDDARVRWRPREFETEEDRAEHGGLRGALVVAGERKRLLRRPAPTFGPLARYAPELEADPVFYRSLLETRRMSQLASEHFSVFRRLLAEHAGQEGWSFLVKLGYSVDTEDEGEGREHLWFEAHAFEGGRLAATLLNEPHMIARMSSGDRDWHAVDQMSDWRITSPDGSFGPDRAGSLPGARG